MMKILIGAILIALIAPALAVSPSYELNTTREAVEPLSNASTINPIHAVSTWGNLFMLDLSGVDPAIFDTQAFRKEPGGLSSGDLYTSSMEDFRNSDSDAGISKVTKKAAKLGLVNYNGD